MAQKVIFVAVSLLLLSAFADAIRTEPADPVLKGTSPAVEDMKHKEMPAENIDERSVDQGCEGVGKEECLMRRTLAAHSDYIYTQDHHN